MQTVFIVRPKRISQILKNLKTYDIDCIIDIRKFPASNKLVSPEKIRSSLKGCKIEYIRLPALHADERERRTWWSKKEKSINELTLLVSEKRCILLIDKFGDWYVEHIQLSGLNVEIL